MNREICYSESNTTVMARFYPLMVRAEQFDRWLSWGPKVGDLRLSERPLIGHSSAKMFHVKQF